MGFNISKENKYRLTLGEVLEEGELLSGSEVAGGWLRLTMFCAESSHTELWLDSSPSDMQGEGAPRLSTEGIEKEPPLRPSM